MEHDGFTVDDVARVLRSNIRHVQKLVTIGMLRVDIGGPRNLVSRQELDRFLRENPGFVR
jgi:hypothetical protein